MRENTALLALVLACAACAQADLRGKVDGSPDPEFEPIATDGCPAAPFSRCDAGPADPGACVGEPDGGGGAALLPSDAGWAVGCVVNVPAAYRTPQGECLVAWSCKCRDPSARSRGATQWACAR